jgi:type I restriction enzyme S subunit
VTSGWRQVPVGEAADLIERPEVPIPGVSYRQIGVRLWGEGAYERESVDGGSTKYKTLNRVEAGDIIVNKIWARNGSVSVVLDGLEDCYCSGEFPLFRPRPERLDPRWFYWITKTGWFWQSCDVQSRGTSGKNRIRPEKFAQIEIPLPPLAEQRRIVAKIERLAAKIDEALGLQQAIATEATTLCRVIISREHAETVDTTRVGELVTLREPDVEVRTDEQYDFAGVYCFGRGVFRGERRSGLSCSYTHL